MNFRIAARKDSEFPVCVEARGILYNADSIKATLGYIELPESAFRCSRDYRADVRQGVEIEYIPRPA